MSDSKENIEAKSDDVLRHRGTNNEMGKSKSQINAEYFQSLEQWLNDVRSYRYSCSFFGGFPYTMLGQQMNGFPQPQTETSNNFAFPVPPFHQGFQMFPFSNQHHQQQQQQQTQQQQQMNQEGVEYTLAPLWKRFVAEFIDFVILFVTKMALTLIAADMYDFVDFEKLESIQLQKKMDYKMAIEITSELLFFEMVHRVLVCLYEGIFLCKGIENEVGGATPGKALMGIKVVMCSDVIMVENHPEIVKIVPATNLGFGWSLARAISKNVVLVFLFPLFVPVFLNKFKRTAYDVLCHSIVVEDRVQPNRNR